MNYNLKILVFILLKLDFNIYIYNFMLIRSCTISLRIEIISISAVRVLNNKN